MAKANPANLNPTQPGSDSNPAPMLGETEMEDGVEIQYIGEGARDVKFDRNPNAARYVVNASGQVQEFLK